MKLVTFGIDQERNLIIQFPIFMQPYTQQPLILYQLQTAPVPIIDQNPNAQSYTELKNKETIHCTKFRNIYKHSTAKLATCKRIGYKFYCKELFMVRHKTIHSYESVIYFGLDMEIIKEIVYFYFTTTNQILL